MRHLICLRTALALAIATGTWNAAVSRAEHPSALPSAKAGDRVLFDFEDETALQAWLPLDLNAALLKQWEVAAAVAVKEGKPTPKKPGPMPTEPAPKIELSPQNATAGKHSLKITFAGGTWPAITTTKIPLPGDWKEFQTFKADVTVSRPCLVGFRIMQEKSVRDSTWEGDISRWEKTALLPAGRTEIVAALHQINEYAVASRWGKVVALEIYMYRPHKGEAIYVDNLRLSMDRVFPGPPTRFSVLGTNHVVTGVAELAARLKDRWTRPQDRPVEQVESDFRVEFEKLRKDHPRAVLAVFRQGQKGYDPLQPAREYAGWKDTHINSHGPDSNTLEIARNYGQAETLETFMRHRSQLIEVDLSSIPKGARILAARLVIIRATAFSPDRNPTDRPTMWVAEPCNRPWVAGEANGYEYARDRFWKSTGGMDSHQGDDPDFWPVYIAFGPSQGKVNVWDFTQAVQFWTEGLHANHGFFLHGDSSDYFQAFSSKARDIKNRPALLVVYEPKK